MARSSSSLLASFTGPNDALFGRHHINSRAWKPKSQQEAEHRQLKAWAQEQQMPQKQSRGQTSAPVPLNGHPRAKVTKFLDLL